MKTKQVEWKKGGKFNQLHPEEIPLSRNTGSVEVNGFMISITYKEI